MCKRLIELFLLLLTLCGFPCLLIAQVGGEDLVKGPDANWLTYLGDYSGHRYSPLSQIDRDNVSDLVASWVVHINGSSTLETTPLVYNGVMYVTNSNEVYALDAATGRQIWHYRAMGAQKYSANRGAAILGNHIYLVTSDCHVVALHRASGSVFWDREFASTASGYSCTGAPLVVKHEVIVGVAASGQRCFVEALSADTGEKVWRFWSVPREGEPRSETWGKLPLPWGGAPTWTTGTYDPKLNTLYWPTGNPWPDFYGADRMGDNLYSDCIVALNADTGKLKWFFQFTPHDTHDWDANETPVLLDSNFRGQPRKLLVQANRNGFYYVLDRTNGQFLLARPFVKKLNWAKGIDSKGRPILIPNMDPSPGGTLVCPSVHGATNWWAPSIIPQMGLLYVVSLEQCEVYYSSSQKPVPNSGFRGTGHTDVPDQPGEFSLRALDATTGEIRWEYLMPGPTTMWAGTLATAGGMVFSADDEGDLVALDARTGKELWHFFTGSVLRASPMTYSVGGSQYVTIASGTNIFTFALSGAAATRK